MFVISDFIESLELTHGFLIEHLGLNIGAVCVPLDQGFSFLCQALGSQRRLSPRIKLKLHSYLLHYGLRDLVQSESERAESAVVVSQRLKKSLTTEVSEQIALEVQAFEGLISYQYLQQGFMCLILYAILHLILLQFS